MPKLPLSLNLPLRVRGIKGVISIIFITPPPAKPWQAGLAPLILRGEFLEKLMKSGCSGGKTVWSFGFWLFGIVQDLEIMI
jgi:hypothetical protein